MHQGRLCTGTNALLLAVLLGLLGGGHWHAADLLCFFQHNTTFVHSLCCCSLPAQVHLRGVTAKRQQHLQIRNENDSITDQKGHGRHTKVMRDVESY
jgi:hypothetical protein